MHLGNLARLLKRHALLLGVFILVGAVGGIGYVRAQVPEYQSATRLLVSIDRTGPSIELVQGGGSAVQVVPTYAEFVKTRGVLESVIGRLGLPLTVGQLRAKVSTDTPPGTALLAITVSDRSPKRAATIANAIGDELAAATATSAPRDRTAFTDTTYMVTQVQAARPPGSPATPNSPVALTLGLLVGFVLGLVVAVLRERWSRPGR